MLLPEPEYDAQVADLVQEARIYGSVSLVGASPLSPDPLYRPKQQVDPAKRWSCAPWERERVPRRFLSEADQRRA